MNDTSELERMLRGYLRHKNSLATKYPSAEELLVAILTDKHVAGELKEIKVLLQHIAGAIHAFSMTFEEASSLLGRYGLTLNCLPRVRA